MCIVMLFPSATSLRCLLGGSPLLNSIYYEHVVRTNPKKDLSPNEVHIFIIKKRKKPLAIRNIGADSFTAQQLSIAMGNKSECMGKQRTNKHKCYTMKWQGSAGNWDGKLTSQMKTIDTPGDEDERGGGRGDGGGAETRLCMRYSRTVRWSLWYFQCQHSKPYHFIPGAIPLPSCTIESSHPYHWHGWIIN